MIQQVGLFPHMTVADNIATVPRLLGWGKQQIRERVDELLDLVDLPAGDYRSRYASQLSGGERQRVGLARALAADPPVMLMDEPFGALDPITRTRLQTELVRIQGEVGKTIIFVTHDIDEAILLGDRIAILREGGVLVQYAAPDELLAHPADDFVARFVGADRGLKRLSLRRLSEIELDESTNGGVLTLDESTTLRDAVSTMLAEGTARVVVSSDDAAIGSISLEQITRLLGAQSAVVSGLRGSLSWTSRGHRTKPAATARIARVTSHGSTTGQRCAPSCALSGSSGTLTA